MTGGGLVLALESANLWASPLLGSLTQIFQKVHISNSGVGSDEAPQSCICHHESQQPPHVTDQTRQVLTSCQYSDRPLATQLSFGTLACPYPSRFATNYIYNKNRAWRAASLFKCSPHGQNQQKPGWQPFLGSSW